MMGFEITIEFKIDWPQIYTNMPQFFTIIKIHGLMYVHIVYMYDVDLPVFFGW